MSADFHSKPPTARPKLLPRQESFCSHYATQPVATRAAVLAGYAERSAYNQGHRLLHCAEVLERIAALRAERNAVYALERDTVHDKLEGVFLDALAQRKFAPAIAAVRLQAALEGFLPAARQAGGRARTSRRRGTRRKTMRNAAEDRAK